MQKLTTRSVNYSKRTILHLNMERNNKINLLTSPITSKTKRNVPILLYNWIGLTGLWLCSFFWTTLNRDGRDYILLETTSKYAK